MMTENQRMIWAAVYAAEWVRAQETAQNHGVKPSVPHMAESACHAVSDLRESLDDIRHGWGDDTDEHQMALEMAGGEPSE